MDKLENVAKVLLEREKISGEEFEIIYNGGELSPVIETPVLSDEGTISQQENTNQETD